MITKVIPIFRPGAPASITPAPLTEVHVTETPDVCLVVSSDTKIFASVAVLRNTSEVFKLMFDARFLEGQAVINNPGCIQEIELPEDEPQAMTFLIRLLHGGYDVPQLGMPKPKTIHKMSILAEKYLACDTIRPALESVLNPLDALTPTGLWHVISAAYLLGNRGLFKEASSQLLQRCSRRYSIFLKLNYNEHREAAAMIALLLEEKRAELKCNVSSGITHALQSILTWEDIESEFDYGLSEFQNSVIVSNGHNLESILDSLGEYAEYRELNVIDDVVQQLRDGLSKGICFDCVTSLESHRTHLTAN